ncbi:MAG TPA: ATP-dependent DNA helicase UvrD2 [Acidimicrobiales bacterium]|nr:ATP-dependent DNA helicase UvrD2 [Acidimicrobiales bacterium]
MTVPGPAALGRGVVVRAGGPVPAPWAGAPVVVVDEAAVAEPGGVVAALHEAWAGRRPVVVALAVDPALFRAPACFEVDPWTLSPSFEPWHDRLHFLVWANTYDARGDGPPVWWWARKAERAGARPGPAGGPDVVLPDGRPAWVDGGPRSPLDLDAAVVHAETVELGRLDAAPPPVPPTAELAPDQLAAVAHAGGPARVIAPAGSGKTRVLTERLRHLLVDRRWEREGVLAVAYNKKAQEELEQRCAGFRPHVRTLNSLGYSLLGRAAGRAPRVLEEREVRRIVEDLVPRRQRRVNTDPIGPYLEALSLVRLGLRSPESVENERDDVPGLAEAFGPFRRRLASAGVVDFDDQVYGAVELLLGDGEFRRAAQAGCRHLLVDEFQDLTPAHVLMLRLLAAPGLDVFGVGDDDQVIYGHAGADPGFLVDYDRYFPGAADHPLEVNYRCPVPVVDAARKLLSYNDLRVPKEIRPGPSADTAADALVVHRHRPDAGSATVRSVVEEWLAEPGCEPAQVAVLARVNSLLLAPHVALSSAGVPIDSVLRPDVLDRTGVRAALAYLRIAADPRHIDGNDVVEVHRRPSRGLPQWIAKWLRGTFTVDRLRAIAGRLDDAKVAAKVEDLVDDLELVVAAAASGTTRQVLDVVKDKVGLGGAMGLLDSSRADDGGSSHLDDLEALEQVADLHPDVATFESWLRGVFHRETAPGGVTLSTVHRVKGREWDRVAVFGVTAGLVPHRLAEDEEEERRVLHVAVTRGRHRVAVLADDSRPSPFLDELAGAADRRPRAAAPEARPARAARSAGPEALPPEAAGAEQALRAWRLERCRRDGVPAYVVLNDRHLRAVATRRPSTLAELRRVDGIGPTRLELYGEEILAVLEAAGA